MRIPRALYLALCASALALCAATPGASAMTSIGSLSLLPGGPSCNGLSLQAQAVAPTTYTIPPDGGVITGWGTGAVGTVKLKVARATGPAGQYHFVSEEGPHTIASSGAGLFGGTHVPVEPGDVIGLYGVGTGCKFTASSTAFVVHDFTAGLDPAPNTDATATHVGTKEEVNVSAIVEPDADHDGFGDETQDKCLGAPGAIPPCAGADTKAPILTLTSKPKQAAVKAKAVTVVANVSEDATLGASGSVGIPGGAAFSLVAASGPAKAGQRTTLSLRIPKNARRKLAAALKEGKRPHATVKVLASDAAGNSSEASQKIAIMKPKKKHRRHHGAHR